MFAEKAMPTPQYELFATAAITPAQLLPWLFKKEKKEKKKEINRNIQQNA